MAGGGEMKLIKAYNKNLSIQVDDEDYSMLLLHTSIWRIHVSIKNKHKVELVTGYSKILQKQVVMSRLILGITEVHLEADHKDRNPLNNQKNNLRVATSSQNKANALRNRNKESSYIGVKSHQGKWMARISWKNRTRYVGIFESAIEAAIARDDKAIELFGEFAVLNFPILYGA